MFEENIEAECPGELLGWKICDRKTYGEKRGRNDRIPCRITSRAVFVRFSLGGGQSFDWL